MEVKKPLHVVIPILLVSCLHLPAGAQTLLDLGGFSGASFGGMAGLHHYVQERLAVGVESQYGINTDSNFSYNVGTWSVLAGLRYHATARLTSPYFFLMGGVNHNTAGGDLPCPYGTACKAKPSNSLGYKVGLGLPGCSENRRAFLCYASFELGYMYNVAKFDLQHSGTGAKIGEEWRGLSTPFFGLRFNIPFGND